MVSLYLDTVRPMIMTYTLLLHCLHPYLLQLSFCHYSYYVIINYLYTSNDTKIHLLAEITLKLGLQEYFPYIAYAFFVFLLLCKKECSIKIHAANLKLRSFLFVFVGDHGKLFLKISQMLVVCICYCYNFHIFLRV